MNATIRKTLSVALTLCILITIALLLRIILIGGINIHAGPDRVKLTCNKPENPFIFLACFLLLKALVARPAPFSRLGRWLKRNIHAILLGAVIAIIAGTLRLYDLGGNSINADELLWIERGRQSFEALYDREYKKATAPFGHPGVVPGVLIGTSYSLLGRGGSYHSHNLIDSMAAARLPVAILGTATCLLLFLVGRAYFGDALSFWAAIFLSLYPSHIALSRVAHIDSSLTLFFTLSLLCYLVYTERTAVRWKIASAILWTFALLSKLPALILPLILIGWKSCLRLLDRRRRVRFLELSDLAWLGLGLGLYFVLYTRLWYRPSELHWIKFSSRLPRVKAISGMIGLISSSPWVTVAACIFLLFALLWAAERGRGGAWKSAAGRIRKPVTVILLIALCLSFIQIFEKPMINQLNLTSKVYTIENEGHLKYWMGTVVSQPPVWFYPFMFIISTPPVTLFFFLCGIVIACGACLRREKGWAGFLLCLIAVPAFSAIMTLGRKMGFRYIDPVIPFVCILAAAGLTGVVELLRRVCGPGKSPAMIRAIHATVAVAVIGSVTVPLWNIFPAYDLYCNFLIGGPAGAAKFISLGWGEGSKQAVEFLKAHSSEGDAIYAMGLSGEFRFYWERDGLPAPRDVIINRARPPHVDWLVIPLSHRLKRLEMKTIRLADGVPKAHSVRMCGIDLVDIYRLDDAPRMKNHRLEAADLRTDNRNVVADPNALNGRAILGRAGTPKQMLTHGPYVRYGPGRWKAVFRIKRGRASAEERAARLSVTGISKEDIINSAELGARLTHGSGVYEEIPIGFTIDRAQRLQFRVMSYGICDFWVDSISLERLQDDQGKPDNAEALES